MDASTGSTQYILIIPRNSFLRLNLVKDAKKYQLYKSQRGKEKKKRCQRHTDVYNICQEEKIKMKIKGDNITE